jgi:hypothetical protein
MVSAGPSPTKTEAAIAAKGDRMKLFELGKHRRARVWLNEQPANTLTQRGIVLSGEAGANRPPTTSRSAAVEFAVPTGGMCMYGLLGATYSPRKEPGLVVEVVSADEGPEYSDAQSLAAEQARVCLPSTTASYVLDSSTRYQSADLLLPQGSLCFDRAVFATVGSSPVIFSALAYSCINILSEPKRWREDDEIEACLCRAISIALSV